MEYNFAELIKQVDVYAKKNLTPSRYEHSCRVAEYAKYLAEHYSKEGVPADKAYFTGLAHDICKKHSDEALLEITAKDGLGVDAIEKTRLNLLHGRAAAIILQEEFNINDESILNAVAFHTFGYEGIDALGKIIFIADKIEPGRPDTQEFRDYAKTNSLNKLTLKILCWNMNFVQSKGNELHPLTKKMYLQIKEELNEN